MIDTSKTGKSITLSITFWGYPSRFSHYTLSNTAYHCWKACDGLASGKVTVSWGCVIIHRITRNKLNILAPRITHGLRGKRPVRSRNRICVTLIICGFSPRPHRSLSVNYNPMKKNHIRLRFHGTKHFVSYHETVRFKRRNTSFHPVKRTDTVVSYI